MTLDPLQLIHEPARLRIMAILLREDRLRVVALRDALGMTDGNLAAHLRRLVDAGYVAVERRLLGGVQSHARITPEGRRALQAFAEELRRLLPNPD